MCLYVTIFASLPYFYLYFVIVYFGQLLVSNISCFVSQINVLTLEFVYCFPFAKFADTVKNKINSLRTN